MAKNCWICNKKLNMFNCVPFYGELVCEECRDLYDAMRNGEEKAQVEEKYAELKVLAEGNAEARVVLNRKKEVRLAELEGVDREAELQAAREEKARILREKMDALLMTTGSEFQGYRVVRYIDVICKEVIFQNSFLKRLDAGLEDLGAILSFEERERTGATQLISNARIFAMDKFKETAVRMGGNAVLGVDFETSFGSEVARVSISGTVVEIEKEGE